MTTPDQVAKSAEDILAEAIAKANEDRNALISAAEVAFDVAEAELSKQYEADINAAGTRFTAAKDAANAAYSEARMAAVAIYNQTTGHDQQAGG